MAEMSFQRQSTERILQERPTFTTRELLDPSIASVLQDSTECISHERQDRRVESHRGASVHLPRSSWRQGSHLPFTSTGLLR